MRHELRTYIVNNFMFNASAEELDDNVSLLDSGVLDSTSVLELVAHLEERYGINIDSTELVPENLDSVARLEVFLQRKGSTGGA